ncbi:NFX1-type zinc finger-containing protein 1-like isoform X2 [Ciona intestinalis]
MQNLGKAGPDFPLVNWLGLPSTEIDIDADESLSEDDNVDDDENNDNDERLIDTDDEMENEDFGRANSVISSAPSEKAALVYLDGKVFPAQYDLKQSRFFPETQLRRIIKQKLTETKIYTDAELNNSGQRLFDLPIKIRWRLYRYWVHQWVLHEQEKFGLHCERYDKLSRRLQFLRRKEEKRILSESYIIGMTTTAAAKYRDVLQDLNVKIVFAEEAAEILEAHIATALPKSTQHLIMIGDNKQSRPRVNMPELSTKHNLGISMLERLIQCGIPSHSLNKQYRMSPNIADLLRPCFYPELTDNLVTLDEMKIKGIRSNVFFVNHNEDETLDHYGKSKVNYYEAEYLLGLCKFLLGQGYKAEDITILTSYTGQMMEIQSQIQTLSLLNKVAVTNIDYFKGQENKIILLSLVCKNEEGKIDFLSAPNRICVALSRASLGLYCIGNFEKLQKHSLWNDITQHLNNRGYIGASLPIACTQHPNSIWAYNGFPETDAWCDEPCNNVLVGCGHLCTQTCHPSDTKHNACEVPCEHVCAKDSKHKCKRVCHEKCDGKCLERVGDIKLECGHEQSLICYEDKSSVQCFHTCPKDLSCGHKCKENCGLPCTDKCMESVKASLICGHDTNVTCHVSKNLKDCQCNETCGKELTCGHTCDAKCSKCFQGRLHVSCKAKCKKILLCGHKCTKRCDEVCECDQVKSGHNIHDVRANCHQNVQQHSTPNISLSNEPCTKRAPCKQHQCIGIKDEVCPNLCFICDEEELLKMDIIDPEQRYLQLKCKHLFISSKLDDHMFQCKETLNKMIRVERPQCPKCNATLDESRYNPVTARFNKDLKGIQTTRQNLGSIIVKKNANRILDKNKYKQDLIREQLAENSIWKAMDRGIKMHNRSAEEIYCLEMSLIMMHQLALVSKEMKKLVSTNQSSQETIQELWKGICHIKTWILKLRSKFTEQEWNDFQTEILRIVHGVIWVRNLKTSATTENQDVEEILTQHLPYTVEKRHKMEICLKQLNKDYKKLVEAIIVRDFSTVSQSTALDGKWYRCPKKHYFCESYADLPTCSPCKDFKIFQMNVDSILGSRWPSESHLKKLMQNDVKAEEIFRKIYERAGRGVPEYWAQFAKNISHVAFNTKASQRIHGQRIQFKKVIKDFCYKKSCELLSDAEKISKLKENNQLGHSNIPDLHLLWKLTKKFESDQGKIWFMVELFSKDLLGKVLTLDKSFEALLVAGDVKSLQFLQHMLHISIVKFPRDNIWSKIVAAIHGHQFLEPAARQMLQFGFSNQLQTCSLFFG